MPTPAAQPDPNVAMRATAPNAAGVVTPETISSQLQGIYQRQGELYSRQKDVMSQGEQELKALRSQPMPPMPPMEPLQAPPKPLPAKELAENMPFYVLMSVLGGLGTRQPLLNATRAMTSAIEGYHKGDMEGFKTHLETWDRETKYALEKNQQLREWRRDLLNDRDKKLSDKEYELELKLKELGLEDKGMSAQAKGLEALLGRLDKHEENMQRLKDNYARISEAMQYHRDMLELRREQLNKPASGSSTPHLLTSSKGGVYRKTPDGVEKQDDSGAWNKVLPGDIPPDLVNMGTSQSSGAVTMRQINRVSGGANEALASLKSIAGLDQAESGFFQGKKAEGGLFGSNAKDYWASAVSSNNVKMYNSLMAGLALEIATTMNQGVVPNETQVEELKNALVIQSNDDAQVGQFKVALAARYMRNALEVARDLANPKQVATIDRLHKQLEEFPEPDEIANSSEPIMFRGRLTGNAGPKEGDVSKSKSGKPIVFKDGHWQYTE